MKKVLHFLNHVEEYAITLILPTMCVVVILATAARCTKLFAMPWGEEMTRYLMIWLVFLGSGMAMKSDAHFNVNALVNLFPRLGRKFFYLFRQTVIAVFGGIILYFGARILRVQMGMEQLSPAMEIPIWLIYLAVPFCGFSIIVRCILNFRDCLVGRKEV